MITKGTISYRLRTAPATVMRVVTLLSYCCPIQMIVKAFSFDEPDMRDWWQRVGMHCRTVHEQKVE
jgi:hypothetical protein